jgi:hypothetical protein
MDLEPDLKKLGKLWKTYLKFKFKGYPNLSSIAHLPGFDALSVLKYHFESLKDEGFPNTPHFYEIRCIRNSFTQALFDFCNYPMKLKSKRAVLVLDWLLFIPLEYFLQKDYIILQKFIYECSVKLSEDTINLEKCCKLFLKFLSKSDTFLTIKNVQCAQFYLDKYHAKEIHQVTIQ